MDIILHFAEIISELTGKDPLLCKGLLRLSIKDQYRIMPFPLTFDTLWQTFEGKLKSRLLSMNILNTPEIISRLQTELRQIQAVLSIGTV